ncbi:MAG: NAD(P)/FAD-dependent oxidoreductase [Lawsonibacter sp.]
MGRGRCCSKSRGSCCFTHFGLSGPLILSASAHLRDFEKNSYRAVIDLKPALDEEKLDARLLRELRDNANKDMQNVMGSLVPRLMVPVALRLADIPLDRKAHDVTRGERRRLLETLKGLTIHIKGPRPIAEAIVTSGGIKVGEIDPGTMQSKRLPGLFFAGELIDVDAYTGGFNLQIAWATGRAAGEGAAAFWRSREALSPLHVPVPRRRGQEAAAQSPGADGAGRAVLFAPFSCKKRRNN